MNRLYWEVRALSILGLVISVPVHLMTFLSGKYSGANTGTYLCLMIPLLGTCIVFMYMTELSRSGFPGAFYNLSYFLQHIASNPLEEKRTRNWINSWFIVWMYVALHIIALFITGFFIKLGYIAIAVGQMQLLRAFSSIYIAGFFNGLLYANYTGYTLDAVTKQGKVE